MSTSSVRTKRSPIWKIPVEELQQLIERSSTITEVLNYFGLQNKGGNHRTLKARLDFEGISYTHIPQGRSSNKGKVRGGVVVVPLEQVLVQNSTYNRGSLKRRLLQQQLLVNECAICGIQPVWNNKKLVLILDHIDGISNNNELANLRLVCPNCNSQLDTHCGRNKH